QGVHRQLLPLIGAGRRGPLDRRLGDVARGGGAGYPPLPRARGVRRREHGGAVRETAGDQGRTAVADSPAGPYAADLARIAGALAAARELVSRFTPGEVEARRKAGGDPVTEADTAIDALLKAPPLGAGEGWLSEGTEDALARLAARRVWVVDPLDGTREFVMGLPEWSISVALVVDGEPVAGGVANPATGETFLGARGHG